MTTPYGRISNEPEEERKREKMPFIVATYVYASSQGQHTHSARTNCTFVPTLVYSRLGLSVNYTLSFSQISK